jgi:aspartate racemase
MEKGKIIGIVGGVGPYAGLDLNRKIFDLTLAGTDQEHLPVILASLSPVISDRTRYLLSGDVENPDEGLFHVLKLLDAAGATVAGIPCNTAHAEPIFSSVQEMIHKNGLHIKLLNMISEVTKEIPSRFGKETRIGVISTQGTHKTGLYKTYLEKAKIRAILPEEALAEDVHAAIYDPGFGIKARSNPVTQKACGIVKKAVRALGQKGADAVILGCTELPLALPMDSLDGVKLIDPAAILARALIRETFPHKLKPLSR